MRLITRARGALLLTVFLSAAGIAAAQQITQENFEDYFNNGVRYIAEKKYPEAEAVFQKVLEFKPDYAEAYYDLAIIRWAQKDPIEALKSLQKVTELSPNSDLARKAEKDIAALNKAGFSLVAPKPEAATVEEAAPQPTGNLDDLIADLEFASATRRQQAAEKLGLFKDPKAVTALANAAGKEDEIEQTRVTAVESLGKIADPAAVPVLKTLLEGNFSGDGKKAAVLALNKVGTSESLSAILSAWAGNWPGGLTDQEVVDAVRKLGKDDYADLVRGSFLQNTGDKKIYTALALGLMHDATGVPAMVSRLKEDYPSDAPAVGQMPGTAGPNPAGPPGPPGRPGSREGPPGPTQSILRPGEQQAPVAGWTKKDETALRTQIVDVLGISAGEKQTPFLTYLSKQDPESSVRAAAAKSIQLVAKRAADSKDLYQKGIALAKQGKVDEAVPIILLALKNNPDAPYAAEIKTYQAKQKYDQALVLLKPKDVKPEDRDKAIALLRSVIELAPDSPSAKDAQAQLEKLQASQDMNPDMMGPGRPGGPPRPPR